MPSCDGKIFYAILFVIILPALLLAWAIAAGENVPLPMVSSIPLGAVLSAFGITLIVAGMLALMRYGKGLPMNPYPPPLYVSRGIYRLLRHPIYAGFSALCIGISLLAGSPGGLWLVSPVVMLCCASLVFGYENIDLHKRFGPHLPVPLLHVPEESADPPTAGDRASVYVLVLLPWLVLYQWLAQLGTPSHPVIAYLPFESRIPVWEWTEVLYGMTYLLVCLVPLVAPTETTLREFSIGGIAATLLMVILFPFLPVVAPPRPFVPVTIVGGMLGVERTLDTPANAFPSYHVLWVLLAMSVFANRMPRGRFVWWALGAAISLSCVTTGMHAVVDVVAVKIGAAVVNERRALELAR